MLLLILLASLMGCAAGEPSPSSPATGEPAAPSTPSEESAAATQTVAIPSKELLQTTKSQGPTFSHKPPRDTVDWKSTNISGAVPVVNETDREWPGERLGLIGPIIAKGGAGSKRYVTVYDSAGVLIGAMTYAEYKKYPQRLVELVKKAQMRTEHQNLMALQYLIQKRMAAEAAAIYKKQGGRHENQ